MQDFIVLGLIPGTHIQIDFKVWLVFCAGLIVLVTALHFRTAVRVRVLSWRVARLIRRHQLVPLVANEQA